MGAKRARLTHDKTLLCRLFSIGDISPVILTVVPAVFAVIYVAVLALAVNFTALSVIFAVVSVRPSLLVCVIQAFLPAITSAAVHMTNRREKVLRRGGQQLAAGTAPRFVDRGHDRQPACYRRCQRRLLHLLVLLHIYGELDADEPCDAHLHHRWTCSFTALRRGRGQAGD